jgi:hypothetical protein
MMVGLYRKASGALDDIGVIGGRKLQRREHLDIPDRGLRGESGRHRSHFGQPMHRLQEFESAPYDGLDDVKRLICIRFAGGILKQPFENNTRIEHQDHGRSAARVRRTSSLVREGRLTRALLSWRNSRSRLIWSRRSRTARRMPFKLKEIWAIRVLLPHFCRSRTAA